LGKGGLIILLAVAACTSTPVSNQPAPRAVEEAQRSRPVGSHMPDDATQDLCRAGELQWLVGKSRNDIPVPVDVINRRVVCTTCPVTMDYLPYRLNIFFNADTNLVEQVRCG
tara:strand:+ start:372 stop:707 length:336 start_codon:yes stop_codon:yes gene_type:complete